jgi:hypothetical protein
MSTSNLLPRALLAWGLLGAALAAQDAPSLGAFKLGIGTLSGEAQKALETGTTFSLSLESAFPLSERGALVGSLGYRQFPGGNRLLSYIPLSVPATGVNPTAYETRNRRTEAKGFELSGLYRYDVLQKELYVQAGVRLGFFKTSETDTGTRLITDGTAIANTGSISNTHILSVNTIAASQEKRATSVGAVAGVGYRFLNRYAAEINFFSTKIETPSAGAKNGFAAELSFSVQL